MVFSYLVLLPCLIALFNTHPVFCSTQYTLVAQGQSMTDRNGTSLVSPGNIFAFGFFSPGNSTSRYVGIRYLNVSTETFLWVANRELPILNDSGTINITRDGSLVVLDGGGNLVWSTNTSSWRNSNSSAQLQDSGNLLLVAGNGSVLWQSFDHPTDTFVPGMKLVLDLKTGENQLLTAWNSYNDPSAGKYSLGLDPKGSAQMFIWEGSVLRWRSGQWNGQTFIGTMMRPLYLYGFGLTNDTNRGLMYVTFDYFNSSLLRFALQPDGVENTTILNNTDWVSAWAQPLNECEFYGKCGENGLCALDANGSPSCNCLRGFEPQSEDDWNQGNWSGGCVRRITLGCHNGDGDGFFMLQGLKLPDLSDSYLSISNEEDCMSFCTNNCSCRAYAYPDGIGCLIWVRDLIDLYKFPQGSLDLYKGNDIYIKLAGSEFDTDKKKIWKILVVVFTLALAIVIICIFLWWKYNARIKDCYNKSRKHISFKSSLRISQEVRTDFSGPSEPGEGQEGKGSELPLFSFESLAAATGNFSDENKLGQGGFGLVYKGILSDGQEIAVKRLSASSGQGADEFKNEVILIAKLQHRNLVRLTGCCIQGEEKMLVYEYMPNKSLDTFLFEPTKQELLDWEKRFDIIEGIARGLVYLHRDSRLRIVHRDLKASNILLDEHMKPKISDFGMARIFGGDENQANTNRLVGTYGYMSPEYAMEGLFSVKSDVYSFGVLVLEIVAGRRNNSFQRIENTLNIVTYAWQLWSSDRAKELIDPAIRASCSTTQVLKCINIALLCVQDHTNDRPDMSSVVIMLGSESGTFALPKQPKFTMVEIQNERGKANNREAISINDVTITVVEGR